MDLRASISLLVLLLSLSKALPLTADVDENDLFLEEPDNVDLTTQILATNNASSEFLIEGDLVVPKTRNAMACWNNYCLWKKSANGKVEVPYIVSPDFSYYEVRKITNAMATFSSKTCVQFVPRSNQGDYLSIENRNGCYSHLGRTGGAQVVSLYRYGCVYHGIIQHEFLHALGFHHEQTRSDRDQYVRINFENINQRMAYNFQKQYTNNLNTPYDYSSVMHYGSTAFSTNGKETITPIPNPNVQIGQRGGMSTIDIQRINKLYGCCRFWRESGDRCAVSQEKYCGIPNFPTSAPADKMETLTFVGNFDHPQPTRVRSCQVAPTRPAAVAPVRREESLTFVGNITHPSKVTQDQLMSLLNSRESPVSVGASIHGVSSTQKTLLNPTILHSSDSRVMKHAHPSTIVNGQMQRSDVITPLLREVGPLKFVGNFNLPAEVLHGQQNMKRKPAQVPDSLAQEGIISQRVSTTLPTSVAPASLPTGACGGIPTHSKSSAVHCTREDFIKMMEHHRHMASYYRELKVEHNPSMQGPVCPKELQEKTGSIHDRSWDEPTQEMCWEDATEGIVLPDDTVEKLNAIPGIWDLGIQMGFLAVCNADD